MKKEQRQALLTRIRERRARLEQVKGQLKSHFVGLDDVIDRIIKSIEVWYVMPELITRPVIVNLWGMTGVGKTDLVRRLVRHLDFNENFLEIQLTNKGVSNSWYSSIHSILEASSLDPKRPGVLLLDEIQRFRSIDERGYEIHDYKFQDVWMLLSDGKFSGGSDNRESLMSMLFDTSCDIENQEQEEEDELDEIFEESAENRSVKNKNKSPVSSRDEPSSSSSPPSVTNDKPNKRRKFQRSYYSARQLKRSLKLDDPVDEIMQWDIYKKLSILEERLKDQTVYEGDEYRKLLIFISGNLDEAYQMAGETNEADIDADIFHNRSKRINMVTIKKSLRKRFKPEQIARFGNVHVIYPSLSRTSYEEIIARKIQEIKVRVKEQFEVEMDIDSSINRAIYRNGVFPVQGTRPIFSTISMFLESSLPMMLLSCIESDQSKIHLAYEDQTTEICGKIGDQVVRIFQEGDLDYIKRSKDDKDRKAKTALHEAGHVLVYVVCFGLAPTQISIETSSDETNGFVGSHDLHYTWKIRQDCIAVSLAGHCAEQMVFGTDGLSAGSRQDIDHATAIAAESIRMDGMTGLPLSYCLPANHNPEADRGYTNLEETNELLRKIIQTQYDRASKILKDHEGLLHEIANGLVINGVMHPESLQDICGKYGIRSDIIDTKGVVYPPYYAQYEQYKHDLAKISGVYSPSNIPSSRQTAVNSR